MKPLKELLPATPPGYVRPTRPESRRVGYDCSKCSDMGFYIVEIVDRAGKEINHAPAQ